jgi:uncharacterized protein
MVTTHSEIRDNMMIVWDVGIEMDDGLVLRADIYRPIAEGRYPVIMSYGPYGKGLSFEEYTWQWGILASKYPEALEGSTNKYQSWEVADPEKWVPHGYAIVRVDSRGAGRSPGKMDPFSIRERQDFYQCIEWAGVQEWSSGKVGLLGISYFGITQWLVAELQPPHLSAICPWEASSDYYRDCVYNGGILCTFEGKWFPNHVKKVQHGVGERGARSRVTGEPVSGPVTLSDDELAWNRVDLRQENLANKLATAPRFQERKVDYSKIKVPILSCGNIGGQCNHLRGNVEGYVQAASTKKWLELHGEEHWTWFYVPYGVELQRRFFDHFLKGVDNGWDEEPPVLLNVRSLDGYIQRKEENWPLPQTQWARFYLDPSGMGLCRDANSANGYVTYDALGDGITYLSPPFEEETEITGHVKSKLFIASSTTDADLFLSLRLFDPQGEEVTFIGSLDRNAPLALGWLRASHRKLDKALTTEYRPLHTHDEIQPLAPNEVYELDVELWPTSIIVPKGYQLGLTVAGKDYENSKPNARFFDTQMKGCGPFFHDDPDDRPSEIFGGKVTVYAGANTGSYLLLPIIPAQGRTAGES